ncbi:MAG TPA: signal peptidase II [Streptosporangiaceae bacterium]|nr:signal peptidase II [Streptosporangiaceae bacterium]
MRGLQAAGGTALNGSTSPPRPAAGGSGPPDGGHRPRRVRLLLLVAALVLVTDLVTKTIVVATLSHRPPIVLLGGLLRLTELRNSGAAFSIGASSAVMTVLFSLIAVGVIIAILRTSRRLRSVPWAVSLGLLLGGAAGNLGDRIFRSPGPFRGFVVDWIQLPHWPVFNVADSCIVCGGVLAVLLAARGVPLEGTRRLAGDEPGSGPPASTPDARPAPPASARSADRGVPGGRPPGPTRHNPAGDGSR